MSSISRYLYSIKKFVVIALVYTIFASLPAYVVSVQLPDPSRSMLQMLSHLQHGIYAGTVYTPAFVLITLPAYKLFRSVPLISRYGGFYQSTLRSITLSTLLAIFYAVYLFGLHTLYLAIRGVLYPPLYGELLLPMLLGYILYFETCACIGIVVLLITPNRVLPYSVVLGYGLFSYFAAMTPILDQPLLHIGWMPILNMLGGLPAAIRACIQLAGLCVLAASVLIFLALHFDLLSSEEHS